MELDTDLLSVIKRPEAKCDNSTSADKVHITVCTVLWLSNSQFHYDGNIIHLCGILRKRTRVIDVYDKGCDNFMIVHRCYHMMSTLHHRQQ